MKTIEETYQKKTPVEHILLRPDSYIGSVEKEMQQMYVWDEDNSKMVFKNIEYVPGLYKIFDEIIVNAADNKIRDPKMNVIKVSIDPEKNEISVYNNGRGIPVRIHKEENVYVPELIFGNLLTSSNYNDDEKKVTGGRNGYGAKLCNIFSKEFIVETADCEVKKYYKQRYRDNMGIKEEPEISRYTKEDFTRITFKPDLRRFKMNKLDDDTVSLLKKRVYDLGGIVKDVKIFLNEKKIPVKGFKEYVKLYIPSGVNIVHQVINDRWELALTTSEEQFQQVSFVNAICTSKGGSHVNHVVERIVDPLLEAIQKKEKGLSVRPFQIKSCMFIFVNCLIENPAFDSQTKENLTLRVSAFGSKCEPISDFVKNVIKNTSLVQKVTSFAKARQSQQLKKTDGAKTSRLSGIPKLEDANFAGTSKSKDCTLILTEGDSAKTLAVSGLSVVGRDIYGVFPLRGKLLNVREASHKQIMDNAEISNIKKILGLQHNKIYEDVSSLRYGHIMIMTDQDHDGSHIKGLIINFLDHFYPSLLKIPGFLQEFITPIVRASKKGEVKDFFTLPEYEEFKKNSDGWNIKYYKGLGTSTSADAKQYFSNLPIHVKYFTPLIEEDKELIDLAFNKKKADARKTWLLNFEPGTFLDQSQPQISISDFVNKELILFSMADNIRSIPSLVDGLKPGQRKVMFSCFKRNLRSEIKVAQLVGYVSEQSAYHHGEQSLCSTIVNLAQDFVGSNNINLLLPIGQFGSRLQGGKDAASPRYIFTSLSPLTRLIFNENDDAILSYLNDDNLSIEPEFYVPIIPMVLVNGAEGIGTGWSTSIPNFNPVDVVENIRRLIRGEDPVEMIPYYRNFRGTIEKVGEGKYQVSGIYEGDMDLEISELPVGTWTLNYKEFLESLVQAGVVKDFKEYHTEKTVSFSVKLSKSISNLKLSTTITINNMVCFDENLGIKKYSTPQEILKEFYDVRLRYYSIRKENMLKVMKEELVKLENKVRFIKEVSTGELVISRRRKGEVIFDLESRRYARVDDYEYLLSMSILSLTVERIEKLNNEHAKKLEEYNKLESKTPKELWLDDLEVFEREYLKIVERETKEYDDELNGCVRKKGKKPKSRKETTYRPKKAKKPKSPQVTENSSDDNSLEEKPWKKYSLI
ncbi:DNA topoisomerase II [Encephalitozoon intestinalis ATCC 50506]|uniref:DNA topoisomerase 2 n=1 Tax=Encephalitozoon intestinalis (strain ATCC 50506) TaxID=876142 RepID=E0S6I5_ENCIT|nr:DNA topoisomerase II [Encephalitozoon intestinalis ATCC 50506]ADM11320.1 DNA topoisomerase II [Encephalitozoon intestinalis ATCC 50506]UTX45006.1 DNA topoisomerase II [Encephalitozoon intestinalis]